MGSKEQQRGEKENPYSEEEIKNEPIDEQRVINDYNAERDRLEDKITKLEVAIKKLTGSTKKRDIEEKNELTNQISFFKDMLDDMYDTTTSGGRWMVIREAKQKSTEEEKAKKSYGDLNLTKKLQANLRGIGLKKLHETASDPFSSPQDVDDIKKEYDGLKGK